MKTKICSKCNKEKSKEKFYKHPSTRDGHEGVCKICKREQKHKRLEKKKAKDPDYWHKKYEKRKTYYKKRYEKEKEKLLKQNKIYRKNNREKVREKKKRWERENRDRRNKHKREKREKEPQYRLSCNISTAISVCLQENKKGRHWEDLVGYTLKELKQRLEVNFKLGMTWDNYGEWHVDHKKPKTSFDYDSFEDQEFKDCWCLANLQPLWAEENFKKSDKMIQKKDSHPFYRVINSKSGHMGE